MADFRRVTEVPILPSRNPEGHKGTFGSVLIVAGSRGMAGAAALAGMAALRGGAGLVTVACPEPITSLVSSFEPSYLTLPLPCDPDGRLLSTAADSLLSRKYDVMALGPGIGQSEELSHLVARLVTSVDKPLIIDADGLNLLAPQLDLLRKRSGPTILTPHPGEFARLQGAVVSSENQAREETAVSFATQHRVILILKGHGTIITDGDRLAVNPTGNPGMATGGTGDVLTGLLAALRGQGMSDFDAAQLAVYLHGLAGDIVAKEKGEISLIARDLVEALPPAFLKHRFDRD